jgi:hypothetical protein
MKFLISLSPTANADPAVLQQTRVPSVQMIWQLYLQGVIREMYALADGQGVVFMAEAANIAALRDVIQSWPAVQSGQFAGDIFELAPFPDLALAFQGG